MDREYCANCIVRVKGYSRYSAQDANGAMQDIRPDWDAIMWAVEQGMKVFENSQLIDPRAITRINGTSICAEHAILMDEKMRKRR